MPWTCATLQALLLQLPPLSPCILAAVLEDVQQEGHRRDGKEHPEEHSQHIPCKPNISTLHQG